ncbi:MAG: glucosylglycerol hydrolase, partial [Halobaculum sp.]
MTGATFRERETESLVEWIESTLASEDDRFAAAKQVTRRLGGQWHDDHATVAIWTPEVADGVPPEAVTLELFTPTESVDPGSTERRPVEFRRDRIGTRRVDEFTVAAVEGVRRGTRDRLGSLYQLRVDGREEPIRDPLADSVPFGAFTPAELYDTDRLDETRADRDYFQRLETDGEPPHRDRSATATEPGSVPRFAPASNLLEIHPGTTTEAETLAGVTRTFEEIGRKQRAGESLTPGETVFAGYDGVQLMPLAPVTENPERAAHWEPESAGSAGDVSVTVERPDSINWGYDIVISGFGAVNPSILETGRPDE